MTIPDYDQAVLPEHFWCRLTERERSLLLYVTQDGAPRSLLPTVPDIRGLALEKHVYLLCGEYYPTHRGIAVADWARKRGKA